MAYRVQHEFDHEPTYVTTSDPALEDGVLVTFDPHLPEDVRQQLARLIVKELATLNPTLRTDEELEEMEEGEDGEDDGIVDEEDDHRSVGEDDELDV